MNKKRFVWSCLMGLALCFLIISTLGTAFAYPPGWLQSHMDGTFKMPRAYHGISFALFKGKRPDYDAMRLAKDRALDELCYQLSVSLKSQFKEYLAQKGDYAEQHVASSLFVSTRKVLSGIEEKARWTDPKKHRHWVLLVIDRAKADRQVEQQNFINEVVNRLDHKQDEILKGIKRITSVLNQGMQVYTDRMNHLENLLETIDTKVGAAGAQTRKEYASLQLEINRLEESRKKHEDNLESTQKQQSKQIEELMHQNQKIQNLLTQIDERIQSDYFLALANDDLKHDNNNDGFWVRIEPDKGQGADYYNGEKIKFRVRASKGCYIKIIYISSTGEGSGSEQMMNTLLFPNVHNKNNWIRAGETTVIGMLGEIEVQPPYGKDVITVVASEKQFTDLKDSFNLARGGYYSEVTSNTRSAIQMRTRGLGVVQPASISEYGETHALLSTPKSVATDTCIIVSHPR